MGACRAIVLPSDLSCMPRHPRSRPPSRTEGQLATRVMIRAASGALALQHQSTLRACRCPAIRPAWMRASPTTTPPCAAHRSAPRRSGSAPSCACKLVTLHCARASLDYGAAHTHDEATRFEPRLAIPCRAPPADGAPRGLARMIAVLEVECVRHALVCALAQRCRTRPPRRCTPRAATSPARGGGWSRRCLRAAGAPCYIPATRLRRFISQRALWSRSAHTVLSYCNCTR